MRSPCIGCEFEHEDKNGDRCANCEKRINYAEDEFMIPTEALEADRAARQETRKIKEIKKPKLVEKPAIQDKPKPGPKPKNLKSRKGIPRPRRGIYIRPTELCSPGEIEKIMEGVKEIANSQLRSVPQQVLWILKEKVEEWKKEHGASDKT